MPAIPVFGVLGQEDQSSSPPKDEIRSIVKERKRRRNEGRNEEGFRKKHWASGKDFSE